MAGKTLVEQLVAMLVSLFSFTSNDTFNGIMVKCVKSMVAFVVIMYVFSVFLNAVGMADNMIGDLWSLVSSLIPGASPADGG